LTTFGGCREGLIVMKDVYCRKHHNWKDDNKHPICVSIHKYQMIKVAEIWTASGLHPHLHAFFFTIALTISAPTNVFTRNGNPVKLSTKPLHLRELRSATRISVTRFKPECPTVYIRHPEMT